MASRIEVPLTDLGMAKRLGLGRTRDWSWMFHVSVVYSKGDARVMVGYTGLESGERSGLEM